MVMRRIAAGQAFRARLAGAFGAMVATLAPAVALACPQCAGRAGGGYAQAIVLGSFVLLPWAVVGAVIKYIQSEPRGAELPRADEAS